MTNILDALEDLKKGFPIIITDSTSRENEADLVVAAQTITNGSANFLVKHSSGVICLATTKEQLDRLKVPLINSVHHNKDIMSTAFAYSLEAKHKIGSGISAIDRAISIRTAGNPSSSADDIVVPGHIFPLQAREGGILERDGHTEASVEMCKLAGLWPAAAIVEVASENGGMLKGEDVNIFANTYRIPIVTTQEIKDFILSKPSFVLKSAQAKLPTKFGNFEISTWEELKTKQTHLVLTKGELKNTKDVPVRIHSQCLTGDVFHSIKCDCGEQLTAAMEYISSKQKGIIIWLSQEGRGIGITNKIKAYELQDTKGLNTIDANLALNLPIDARTYDCAIEILNKLNLTSIELLTNNPEKINTLKNNLDCKVAVKPLIIKANKENKEYLQVKKNLMNHLL
ncbi:GTP cyclohydrolase II [Rickettsiales bacterium LUAb2]